MGVRGLLRRGAPARLPGQTPSRLAALATWRNIKRCLWLVPLAGYAAMITAAIVKGDEEYLAMQVFALLRLMVVAIPVLFLWGVWRLVRSAGRAWLGKRRRVEAN